MSAPDHLKVELIIKTNDPTSEQLELVWEYVKAANRCILDLWMCRPSTKNVGNLNSLKLIFAQISGYWVKLLIALKQSENFEMSDLPRYGIFKLESEQQDAYNLALLMFMVRNVDPDKLGKCLAIPPISKHFPSETKQKYLDVKDLLLRSYRWLLTDKLIDWVVHNYGPFKQIGEKFAEQNKYLI